MNGYLQLEIKTEIKIRPEYDAITRSTELKWMKNPKMVNGKIDFRTFKSFKWLSFWLADKNFKDADLESTNFGATHTLRIT